jgi:pullulanase
MGDNKFKSQAHWLSREYIAWPVERKSDADFHLHHDPDGEINFTSGRLQGGQTIPLEYFKEQLSPELSKKYPHLKDTVLLKIPNDYLSKVAGILKGQFFISVLDRQKDYRFTGIQIPGVLDDLYSNNEFLGVTFRGDHPVLRLWAPTAKSVTLHLFENSRVEEQSSTYPMQWNPKTGIWSITGKPDWANRYYLYEVEVYTPLEGEIVRNMVTDPYSLSLSMNSTRSQIIDLDDPSLKPKGWDLLEKPELHSPTDIVLYELHLRDFSAFDPKVPEEHRGTYLAFSHPDIYGMEHLKRLAKSGLTHVHLLPAFDFATVNEDKSKWSLPDYERLKKLPPDSKEQQAAVVETRDQDGYNWGYDPFHYTTPEGSYSSTPDGSSRVIEFRHMVMALNQIGLRVVMDVVYNHTHAAGQAVKSILGRIVPGYYHRLDANGEVITSSCCPNTASEHAMMEKLIIDSLLVWVRDYKIDGFRFDLMGHHMTRNMLNIQAALNELTPEKDGIDGSKIFLYGEGWNFGEVANNARGENATQTNLSGTGVGTFNDRMRDALRGGTPFSSLQEQGYATGLYTHPNETSGQPNKGQLDRLLFLKDLIRISLAGNLADFPLHNAEGRQVTGEQVNYNGSPAGYTRNPQENIVYASVHDNETLFDAIQLKAPRNASMGTRLRMHMFALSLVAISQGVPFFHAGSEMLRSKSLDRNSYNSGDWFNKLDFTYQSNNWGVGLPPKDTNGSNWQVMKELLAKPELKPDQEHILAALTHFEEMLQIRKSSPLFRLQKREEILKRVRFHNTGPEQNPGLIVMSITDQETPYLDEQNGSIIVLFNASKETQDFAIPELGAKQFNLHPIQADSKDATVRSANYDPGKQTFTVPSLTTAVFVHTR